MNSVRVCGYLYASLYCFERKVMKSGDTVELKLYDDPVAGSVVKVYKNKGWEGYIKVLLETKQEVTVPISCLKVIDGN